MSIKWNRWMFALSTVFITSTAFAQFSFDGQVRPRSEYLHGFGTLAAPDQDAAFFIEQRTRLNAGYRTESYHVYISMQDIRAWGANSQLNRTDAFTSLHQGWAEVKFNPKWSLKMGRQEISYDDERIFGATDWAQQARSHDAAILKFKANDKFHFDIAGAFNQNKVQSKTTLYTVPNSYKSLLYLWGHYDVSEQFGFSFLAMNQGLQALHYNDDKVVDGYRDEYNQTFGTYITYKKNKFKTNVSGYYSMGEDGQWDKTKLSAYEMAVDISYKIKPEFSVLAGVEYLSGQSQTETDAAYYETNHAFNPWYGTNHKFNGHMDYFYVGGQHMRSVGLIDPRVELKWQKDDKFIRLDGHFFQSAANVLDVDYQDATGLTRAMSANLGTELDLILGFNLAEGVGLKAGYSQMFATETMEVLKGGDRTVTQNWAWVMINFQPNFLKEKSKETPKV